MRLAVLFFLLVYVVNPYERAYANQLGLPPVNVPAQNPQTPQKIALGKSLFFDKRLSRDGTVSCASCHFPHKAFTDGIPLAKAPGREEGTRNTPSLVNVTFNPTLFWDGRSTSLEQQAASPLFHLHEHGLTNESQLTRLVAANKSYVKAFRTVFGVSKNEIEVSHISKALASFQRSIVAGNSAFDRYEYGKDKHALNASAKRGLDLFRGRAGCAVCHTVGKDHALFTDHDFHSLNVGLSRISSRLAMLVTDSLAFPNPETAILSNPQLAELGRYLVTKDPKDIGKFRTPSLRNVAITAPYMHDGSVSSLVEAIDLELYYRSIADGRAVVLTQTEKMDLASFLQALTSVADVTVGGESEALRKAKRH